MAEYLDEVGLARLMALIQEGLNGKAPRRVVSSSTVLSAGTYNTLGVTDSVVVTLPDVVSAADKFVFAFECRSSGCQLTLPSGVELVGGLDFESDVLDGRWFEVMIRNGKARYVHAGPPFDSRVDYLEGDGLSWIDTGVVCSAGVEAEVDLTVTQWMRYGAIFGNFVSEGADAIRLILTTGNNGSLYWNQNTRASSSKAISSAYSVGTRTVLRVSEEGAWADDVLLTSAPTIHGTANTGTPMFLFAFDSTGSYAMAGLRIHGFRLMVDGELILDLVPVRVGTVGMMWDRVGRRLLGNAGTGVFGIGNDV